MDSQENSTERKFTYSRRTWHSIQLQRLRIAVESDVHERVLEELSRAIKTRCARAHGLHDDDEASLEEERQLIESLLGTAYVICQTKITDVVARVSEMTGKRARALRSMGPKFSEEFSKIDVLWELGNYFKHGDEWPLSEWDEPTKQRRETVRTLKAAGVSGGTGSLRQGAESLGNKVYSDTAVFHKIVDEWAAEVANSAREADKTQKR